jgi:hypothetical protein
MPNEFLTMQNIAREGLPILANNLVFPTLVYQDYSADFVGKGDTIQIEKPPIYEADEFNENNGIQIQATSFGKVPVTMDKVADVSVEISSKDLALSQPEFPRKVTEPAMVALAEKINRDGLEVYKDIPYYSGVAGTIPSAVTDFTESRRNLTLRKAPDLLRRAVWDPYAEAKFLELEAFVNASKSGTTETLRNGAIGRAFGFDNFQSQSVRTHTAGGFTAVADVSVTAGAAGATSIALTSAAGVNTTKLLKGDLFKVDGHTYVVTEDTANAVAGVIAAVKIYPALHKAFDAMVSSVVTFPDVVARAHTANLLFHQKAFAFVTRAMPIPKGMEAYVTSYNGVTLRVVQGYDINTKKFIMSFDVLYAYKTIYPELAEVRLG